MQVSFPLEFLVEGTPPSLQSSRSEAKSAWKKRVYDKAKECAGEPFFAHEGPATVTIFYFPDGPMVGDLDNIIKYTIDGLSKNVLIDDNQIERIAIQKFEPGRAFQFANPSATLTQVLDAAPPIMYIKLADDPFEELS